MYFYYFILVGPKLVHKSHSPAIGTYQCTLHELVDNGQTYCCGSGNPIPPTPIAANI